ncbi:MAG TPA: hypothetical protein DCP69_00320 [Candidatus Omnitrophica bacterium]|nr:hypothetical protein [Candidatus Omnitrophota bacterium]
MPRLDVVFGAEVRPRPLTIGGPPGLSFADGDRLLFQADIKPLMFAIIEVVEAGRGPLAEWAKKARANLPGVG